MVVARGLLGPAQVQIEEANSQDKADAEAPDADSWHDR